MGEAQGKKIASEPLRGKAGERSDRIVAPDPPVKRPAWTRGHRQFAKEGTGSDALQRPCDVTGTRALSHAQMRALRHASKRQGQAVSALAATAIKAHMDTVEGGHFEDEE